MTAPRSAAVIGDGLVGLSVAIALQRRGTAVTLIAPDAPWRGASWGNAGHIAVEQVAPLASLATIRGVPRQLFSRGGALGLSPRDIAAWLPFGMRLLRASAPARFARGKAALAAMMATAMPAWRRLLADCAAPELLREDGHFVVWESPAAAARGRDHWRAADTGTATHRDATADELAAIRERVRRPIAGAIRFAGSGQVTDHVALGEALRRRFANLGGQRLFGIATRVAAAGHGARITLADGGTHDAEVAVIAAGAASRPLAEAAGLTAPLIAERGYHIQSETPDWPATLPPLVFEERALVVTRFAHSLRATSFVEFSRIGSPPDPRKWARLRQHAAELGLGFGAPLIEWIGCRPTLPDYLPAIGRGARHPAIAYAFGHQHLGLTLSATTGEALAAALHGEPVPFDLAPFDLARFDLAQFA